MKIETTLKNLEGKITGYTLWLSANDTQTWAHCWPCSGLRNRRIMVSVDSNGLCDLTIDGHIGDCDGCALDALVSDYLPTKYRHLWPCWATTNQIPHTKDLIIHNLESLPKGLNCKYLLVILGIKDNEYIAKRWCRKLPETKGIERVITW